MDDASLEAFGRWIARAKVSSLSPLLYRRAHNGGGQMWEQLLFRTSLRVLGGEGWSIISEIPPGLPADH